MHIEQFVMAYGAEQDRLRAILPDGFVSLRPVLRINAEIIDGKAATLAFNTAVERDGKRGWLNIGCWPQVAFEQNGQTAVFTTDNLTLSFTKVGVLGSCPAEKDNDGCFFLSDGRWHPPESITANKEFCDCTFCWNFGGRGAGGHSIGKTLPAIPSEPKICYPKAAFSVETAATVPCDGVLGAYVVAFERR